MPNLKGFRTLASNGLVMLFSGIEVMTGAEIAVDDKTAVIAGALALINVVFRMVTTGPVGKK